MVTWKHGRIIFTFFFCLKYRFRGRFQPNPFAVNSLHNEYFFRVSLAKVVFVLLFEVSNEI